MSDSVARGAANPQTIRELMQSIESNLYYALLLSTPHEESVEAMRTAREDAVAALDLLDNTEAWYRDQHHYELGGWGEVQLHSNDDCVRLVPDHAPRGDAE